MEDDAEVLDWGHEEEDGATHGSEKRTFSVDDAEDAVSLGGDEEDEFLAYQSRVPQDIHRAHSPAKGSRQPRHDSLKDRSDSPLLHHSQEQATERTGSSDPSSLHGRTLVHALPPKPVASNVSFVHPSHPSIIEATAMASRADRDKRNGASSKASPYDHDDSLPPGWEVKYPRNGRGFYYYNIHTHESTWTRPTATTREKRGERLDRRDDSLDKSSSTRNDEGLIPRVGRTEGGDMSYGDRHYRPGESGRREERPPSSTQLIDSYVPDSYSPNHRHSRPSPPPPRTKERDPTPPSRRPPSPDGSYGDRDGMQSAYHEGPSAAAMSAQDRVWVARDAPHERPRERRQHDDLTTETERRNLPRDTERSSTLRPRSPTYTRGSQESAAPHPLVKPSQPISEAPPLGRKSRFSQADSPVQYTRRQSESRDIGTRRPRTDDPVSHSSRHVDNIPSSRPTSDVRGDDDNPSHPASDAQRPGSRKRTPLPPQDEIFRPAARSVSAQRGGSYSSGPIAPASASVPDNRHISRSIPDDMPRDSARRSPSPRPHPGSHPLERGDRDRGRPRWSKSHANGPPQMDSHITHESSRGRAHDVTMDVDDHSLPRSSDPPIKQIPPRRPALQDEVPRYPRAMLNPDNEFLSRGVREARDGIDSRHRYAVDDPSRFGSSRDRTGMERHSIDQNNSQASKEPIRGLETRPPPSTSNIKLSGTNNIPIGARNKFAGNMPPLPVLPSGTRQNPTVTSGSNGEPSVSKRDRVSKDQERPPHRDGIASKRTVPMEPARREDTRLSPSDDRVPTSVEPVLVSPTRPSRAALGISRFGPPIVKDNTEPVRQRTNISPESFPSPQVPEGSMRATPPPPSRESSMASFKDVVVPPGRPDHLPPRPVSSPRGNRYGAEDVNNLHNRPNAQTPLPHDSRADGINAEAPARPRPSSPVILKRVIDVHPPEPPPAMQNNRIGYNSEHPRTNFRDSEVNRHVTRPPPSPAVQDEDRDRALPSMHPERALMLQVNGLPPRPPNALGQARFTRGLKRDRRDDRDHDRAEPLRGNNRGQYDSAAPGSERRRFPEDDRSVGHSTGGGASLLDRLTLDEGSHVNSPSLRDRVQMPFKRDREEMLSGDLLLDTEGDDFDALRRVRRRGGNKVRKGRF